MWNESREIKRNRDFVSVFKRTAAPNTCSSSNDSMFEITRFRYDYTVELKRKNQIFKCTRQLT